MLESVAALLVAASVSCSPSVASAGLCGAIENAGDRVDIGASMNRSGGGHEGVSPGGDGFAAPGAAIDDDQALECFTELCRPMEYQVELLPEVTVEDLASFAPAIPTFTGEPEGVAVVGMPANLYAGASAQLIAGELFDYDVVVRFVPAAFRFDYGDGTALTSPTGGASWTALGQAEFTPTPTSHVYTERGTYTASATALYSASVDFGIGGWLPVPGYVEAVAGGYTVRAVEVRTALVDRTCAENPSGPGC